MKSLSPYLSSIMAALMLLMACAANAAEFKVLQQYGQGVRSVAIRPPYVYAGSGNGIQVLRIHQTELVEVTRIGLRGFSASIVEKDGFLYVPVLDRGLDVVDVRDPSDPTVVYSYQTSAAEDANAWWTSATISGEILVVGSGNGGTPDSGLHIFDVSIPASPSHLGHFPGTSGFPRSVAVSGSTAYFALGDPGRVGILDASNPAAPVSLGALTTPNNAEARSLLVRGTTLYVANSFQTGLSVFDISNPTTPDFVTSRDTPNVADGLAAFGNYLYLADFWDSPGIIVYDITNPQAPTYVRELNVTGNAAGDPDANDGYLAVPTSTGLALYSLSNPSAPTLLDTWQPDEPVDDVYRIIADGNRVLAANFRSGITGYRLEGDRLKEVATLRTRGEANDVAWNAPYAYVSGNWASTIDVVEWTSDDRLILQRQMSPPSGSIARLLVRDDHLYAASSGNGIFVYDVQNASNPNFIRTVAVPQQITDMHISGSLLYTTDGSTIVRVYSLTNPGHPSLASTISVPFGAQALDVQGSTMAITRPSQPATQLFTLSLDGLSATPKGVLPNARFPQDVLISGTYVMVASHKFGTQLYDASNLDAPVLIDTLDTMAWQNHLSELGPGLLAMSDGVGGIWLARISDQDLPPLGGRIELAPTVRIDPPSIDPEGSPVTYLYRWSTDSGKEVVHGPTGRLSDTLLETGLIVPGETWTIEVTPFADGVAGDVMTLRLRFNASSPSGWTIF